jgi:hypothetical protein
MAEITGTGTAEMRLLSVRLKEAGEAGKGLRRKMYKNMNDAAKPLAREISDAGHLRKYMPDRYAEVLARDLGVRVTKYWSSNPRVEVRAKARQHKRKIATLDAGRINHPVYARGPRREWRTWVNAQTGGMRAGFFSDVVPENYPKIRDKILQAMTETAREVTGR